MSTWREVFEKVKASRPTACSHLNTALGVITTTNGMKQYKRYCLSCGSPTTGAIAHDAVAVIREMAVPSERFRALQDAVFTAQRSMVSAGSKFRFEVWRSLYDSYLLSWEWKKTRRRALERTGNLCEECGGPAEDVHHKTYERIGAEADEDLSPLCVRCHEEHHPHMKAEQGRHMEYQPIDRTPVDRALAYLASVPPAVHGEGRDIATFKVACALVRGFGLSDEDALPLLVEWNAGCRPPWSVFALRGKLRSARANGQMKIGELLEGAA